MDKRIEISKALTMSLDDYAREAGMYIAPCLKQPKLNKNKSKFDRIEEDEMMDEDDEDDLFQINVNGEECILKEIKSETVIESDPITTKNVTENNNNNSTFDLRSILNGQSTNTNNSNNNNKIPRANSQQWRLMYPNNTHNRPAGMPPLIDNDAELTDYNINQREKTCVPNNDNGYRNHNNNNNGYRNHNNNNNGYRNHNNNNGYRNHNNNNNNRNRPYNTNNNQGRNNFNNNQGRNNYNNNNNQQRIQMTNNNTNSNETAYQYYQQNNRQCRMIDGSVPNDLTIQFNAIESPQQNSSILKKKINNDTPILPLMSIPRTSLSMVKNSPSVSDNQNNFHDNSNVSQCSSNQNINNNNNNALIPHDNTVNLELTQLSSIASTLLETLRNSMIQEQKTKYDMKLQKEIHVIQKKPMIYKCPSGEVISSDGPGLRFGVKPTTTGISLNQRFA